MKNLLLLLFGFILLTSCSNDDDGTKSAVPSTLIAKGVLTGDGMEGIPMQNLVITDTTMWNSLMNSMDSANNVTDRFTETQIDFNSYTVIAVFDEVKTTGGYSIGLDIEQNSTNIVVNVNHLGSQNDNVVLIMTQPYHIVKIANNNLPIVFQ